MTRYYVDKTSNTSADTLLAIGFALLLQEVLQRCQKPRSGIWIGDAGPSYIVEIPTTITADDLQQLTPFTLVKPIVTETQTKNLQKQGRDLDGFGYQAQQEIARIFYERLKKLPAKLRTPEARLGAEFRHLPDIVPPDPDFVHYQAINQMKIASSFNELALRWKESKDLQRDLVLILLTLFEQPGNDVDAAIAAWQRLAREHKLTGKESKDSTTQLQIVNPTTGKGSNRSKSGTIAEGNPDEFWLLELLKFLGFLHAAAPYVIQGSKDRKTYVLQPQRIELRKLQGIMRAFRSVCWSSTVVKMDVMASLRFAQVFLRLREQSLRQEVEEEDEFLEEEELASIAQGFEVAFYKDMGSAYATMNISSINLPQWIPRVPTLDTVRDAHVLLQEHLVIIQQIRSGGKNEEGAEEFELLRFYRNFLSGRDLKPFWQFTTAYSGYLISQREHEKDPRRHLRQFTCNGLEQLLAMSTQEQRLTTITGNPGFKRIAYAIRQSTVWAQFRRAQLRDRTYEVRYGLGQELMREARYEKKFLVALSTFLSTYNAETAREEEKVANRVGGTLTSADRRKYNLRGTVSHADIDQIVELVDAFGSEIVCSLLVAYGYASDPRKEASELGTTVPGASEEDVEATLVPEQTGTEEQ